MLYNNFVVRLADIQPPEAANIPEGTELPEIREEVVLKGSFYLQYNDRNNTFSPQLSLEFPEETISFFKQAVNREELSITANVSEDYSISVSVV